MKSSTAAARRLSPDHTASSGLVRGAILRRLQDLRGGQIKVVESRGENVFGEASDSRPPVSVWVHDSRFYLDLALGGTVGAAESYMQGRWATDHLTDLTRLLVKNRHVLNGLDTEFAAFAKILRRVLAVLQRNSRKGSRRNISAHYDLGNDFFSLFLDRSMTYSCGIFAQEGSSMLEASRAKHDVICKKLELNADDHLMEIGTGWGELAIHAATHYGCHVTTTTISKEQHNVASKRVQEAGLADRVTLLEEDYRDLSGKYDKLVSVEMIEAVGHQYYDDYFAKCGELLRPDGMMLLQSITIADQHYERAKSSVDFIKQYIFPGGCLPSVTAILEAVTGASDLRLFHMDDIGMHYATTLQRWRERFHGNLSEIRALGYPEEFLRMWEFYFCYCEGGFRERFISNVQLLLVKPGCRRPSLA